MLELNDMIFISSIAVWHLYNREYIKTNDKAALVAMLFGATGVGISLGAVLH